MLVKNANLQWRRNVTGKKLVILSNGIRIVLCVNASTSRIHFHREPNKSLIALPSMAVFSRSTLVGLLKVKKDKFSVFNFLSIPGEDSSVSVPASKEVSAVEPENIPVPEKNNSSPSETSHFTGTSTGARKRSVTSKYKV